MNIYQVTNHIDSVIRSYEAKASTEENIGKLNDIYRTISDLKIIRKFVNELEVSLAKNEYEATKGRKVLEFNAMSRAEALVALDMVKTAIMDANLEDAIHETVYVTNEGSAWCG